MKDKEYVQYLERQINKSILYMGEALKKENLGLAALNMKSHFMENMQLALIHWRMGQSPVVYMRQALESLLQHLELLTNKGADPKFVQMLPLYYSLYIASLLNAPHPPLNVSEYGDVTATGVFFGNVMMGMDSIESWPKYKDKVPNRKNTALVRATFDLYAGLLSGEVSAREGVIKGETYYKRRRDDAFYNNLPLILGGTDRNDRYVDFQLAAVLKHIGSTVPSIHAWRW